MSLSINPLATIIANASQAISKSAESVGGAAPQTGNALAKANVDATVARNSGAIGSGLNGLTGSSSTFPTGANTALGGIGSAASSVVTGGINSLQSAAGSISNITADISGSINKLTGGSLGGGLSSLAGSISSAAGMLNNFLSLARGRNLPAGGELFAQTGAAIQLAPGAQNDWRVRIQAPWQIFNSPLFQVLENTGGVVWPYNPSITVSTKADYTPISPAHSNYPFYAYKNSQVDDIQISGEFSCETEQDAAYWIAATTFFKTATKMFFGTGEKAGNPPIICNLTGYGASVFDKVPVIITAFSVDLKDDVNYIKCNAYGTNTWVPVLSTISVTCKPVYNRRRQRQFSLENYAKGEMTKTGVGYI